MRTAWGENPALSYRNMRTITGSVGLTLPVVLLLAGVVDGHSTGRRKALTEPQSNRPSATAMRLVITG